MVKVIDFHSHFNQFPDWGAGVKDFKRLQGKYRAAFVPIIAAHWGKKSYEKQFWQLMEKVKTNPDLFLGMAFWLDGNNLGKSLKLVKTIPRPLLKFLKTQSCRDKLFLKNKIYFKAIDLASNLNLPLYFHCTKDKRFVELEALEKLVAYKPKVVKIIGHMGGAYLKYNKKALQIMLKYPNSYLDTSATFHSGTIEASVKAVGSKRLLFGSDFPVLDFNKQRLAVANAKITKEDKQNILLNNAANLLRIKLG